MDFEFNIRHIQQTFVKQHGEFFCGLACLASIVKFHGGETTQEKLREISGTTRNGTTMLGLYQAAQKCGFEAGGFRAEVKNLKEISDPVILHIVKENNLEHFVVCYGFQDNMFLIGDPDFGLCKYSEEKVKVIWKSRTLLHLIPGKGFVTKKQEKKRKRNWFFNLIKEDYPVLGIAAFLGVLISVFGLATALFSQRLIDQILPDKDIRTLVVGLILFFLILFVRAYLNYIVFLRKPSIF